jgi:hypothetical protein
MEIPSSARYLASNYELELVRQRTKTYCGREDEDRLPAGKKIPKEKMLLVSGGNGGSDYVALYRDTVENAACVDGLGSTVNGHRRIYIGGFAVSFPISVGREFEGQQPRNTK